MLPYYGVKRKNVVFAATSGRQPAGEILIALERGPDSINVAAPRAGDRGGRGTAT